MINNSVTILEPSIAANFTTTMNQTLMDETSNYTTHDNFAVFIAHRLKFDLPLTDITKYWVVLFVTTITLVLGSKITIDALSHYKLFARLSLILRLGFRTSIGAVLSVFLLPFLVMAYVVLWNIAQISNIYVKATIGKHLTKATGLDAMWASDTDTTPAYICSTFKVIGVPNIDGLRAHITEKILNVKSSSGTEQFLKLKQILCRHAAYFYWKNDRNFDVKNHTKIRNLCEMYPKFSSQEGICGQDIVCNYLREYGSEPIGGGNIPQWEILCLITGRNEFFYLIRCHHGIADGLSFVRILLEFFNDKPIDHSLVCPIPSRATRFLLALWSFAFIPYAVGFLLNKGSNNELHGKKLNGKKHYIASPGIPYEIIKKIKNRSKTTAHDVLFTSVTAAVRKNLCKKSDNYSSNFTLFYPVGFVDPTSELELKNSFSLGLAFMPLPVVKSDNQLTESTLSGLYTTHDVLCKAKEDLTSLAIFYLLTTLVYVIPIPLGRFVYRTSGITIGVSNVPGPPLPLTAFGQKLTDMRFWSPDIAPCGIVTTFITQNGILRSNLRIDDALVNGREEAEQILNDMINEIKRMAKILKIEVPSAIC